MKRALIGISLLCVSGCSDEALIEAFACFDPANCSAGEVLIDDLGGPAPAQVPFDPVIVQPGDRGVELDRLGLFDPFVSPFLGFDQMFGSFSSLLDVFSLGLFDSSGPRLDDSVTILQRLCEDGDSPEWFCRRRFGN